MRFTVHDLKIIVYFSLFVCGYACLGPMGNFYDHIADIPDLEACSAFGETSNDALREVEIAKALWLKAAKAKHHMNERPLKKLK